MKRSRTDTQPNRQIQTYVYTDRQTDRQLKKDKRGGGGGGGRGVETGKTGQKKMMFTPG